MAGSELSGDSQTASETRLRAQLSAERPSRGAWIRIVGPLAALFLGAVGAALYLHPVAVLRWLQLTQLGWSGVTQQEIALNDGLMTFLVTGGYANQEPVIVIHGLGPSAALEWRTIMSPIAEAHYKVFAPNLLG